MKVAVTASCGSRGAGTGGGAGVEGREGRYTGGGAGPCGGAWLKDAPPPQHVGSIKAEEARRRRMRRRAGGRRGRERRATLHQEEMGRGAGREDEGEEEGEGTGEEAETRWRSREALRLLRRDNSASAEASVACISLHWSLSQEMVAPSSAANSRRSLRRRSRRLKSSDEHDS